MGVTVYYFVVAAVLVFGALMPQEGTRRKYYIFLMFVIHTFVCACRYSMMHGDLMKYAWNYSQISTYGWFSDQVFSDGRNFAFFWLMKLVALLSDNQFQYFLALIAIISEAMVAYLIYRYSDMPWLSYLLWNCVGFFIFGFYALKQILAMALLVPAFVGIIESRPKKWLIWTLIAGAVHQPALVFLLAYPICKKKMDGMKILMFFVGIILIYQFRDFIVSWMATVYYDEERNFMAASGLGGRFAMMFAIMLSGILFRGFADEFFSRLFSVIVIAVIFQIFSRFGNIFTRLSDYYFQFVIIYVPVLMGNIRKISDEDLGAVFRLHPRLKQLIVVAIVLFSVWFYQQSSLTNNSISVDNLANYRFMWEVQ